MRALLLAAIGGALLGCAGEEPIDTPEATLDAADAIEAEATFLFAIAEGTVSLPGTDAEVLAGIAANVPVRWQPAGCAHVIQPSGTSLMFTFEGCSGPRGLVDVTGTLELQLVGWAERPVFSISSPSMAANGSTFPMLTDATDEIYLDGEGIDGSFTGMGVGPRGYELEPAAGSYVMSWQRSSGCSTLRARADSDQDPMVGEYADWVTKVDVTRCPGRCPSGTVARRFSNDAELQVDMDGTTVAAWTSSGDRTDTRSGTFDLPCE